MSNSQELEEARQDSGRNKGFTLIEMLIVIAVLGILSVVVVLSLGGTTTTAKDKACIADRQTVLIAAEAYNAKNGSYPVSDAVLSPTFLQSASVSYTVAGTPATTATVLHVTALGTGGPNLCTTPTGA